MASSTKLKGNVIPGVAIATALMPPLCTAGFGLGKRQPELFLRGILFVHDQFGIYCSCHDFRGAVDAFSKRSSWIRNGKRRYTVSCTSIIFPDDGSERVYHLQYGEDEYL